MPNLAGIEQGKPTLSKETHETTYCTISTACSDKAKTQNKCNELQHRLKQLTATTNTKLNTS